MHRLRYLEINWLSWAFKQREAVWLNSDGFLCLTSRAGRVDIVFQGGMESMTLGLFLIGAVLDPPVDEGVADRIRDIVAHESCEECRRLLFLLSRVDLGEL